jgi:pimeloyl-ACP methyl ester carboxylesterase
MKRRGVLFFCAAAAATAVILTACTADGNEPPFETTSTEEIKKEAQEGFGWYAYQPGKADSVRVRRVVLEGEWERGFSELPIDIYYPLSFAYDAAEPAVLVLCGSTEWSSTISLGAMLAAEGITAAVIHTQAAGQLLPEAIDGLRERAEELFIDRSSLAVWSEGHSVPEALECVLDRESGFHEALRGAVFISPVMYIGEGNMFVYEKEAMSNEVPLFIGKAEKDGFYEVNASVKQFMEAAERYGLDVRYTESPVGGHNFMLEEDDEAAVAVIKDAVRFIEAHLRS